MIRGGEVCYVQCAYRVCVYVCERERKVDKKLSEKGRCVMCNVHTECVFVCMREEEKGGYQVIRGGKVCYVQCANSVCERGRERLILSD